MPEQCLPMSGEPQLSTGGPATGSPPTGGGGGWSHSQLTLLAASAPAVEGPLDLTTRPSSPPQRASPPPSPPSAEASHETACVMDLSLPDKDSQVEACYTCGTLVRPSSLHGLLVQPRQWCGDEPYFPSLLEVRRPGGSRPMTPDGRVRVCACCLDRLLAQWRHYENEDKVPAGRRGYSVTAAVPPPQEFVCYMCCLTYSVACLNRLCVSADAAAAGQEAYPEILWPVTPPGVEGVRGGAVSICANCRRKVTLQRALQQGRPLPADSHCYRIIEESVRGPRGPSPPGGDSRKASTFQNIRLRRSEVVCLSCRGTHQRDFMVEVRLQSGDRSRMHFPALAQQPRPPGVVVGRSTGLVCVPCYRALKRQWGEYQARDAPVAERVYSTRRGSCGSGSEPSRDSPPVHAGSPALPETSKTEAPAAVQPAQPAQSSPRLSGDRAELSQSPVKDTQQPGKRSSPVDSVLPERKYQRAAGRLSTSPTSVPLPPSSTCGPPPLTSDPSPAPMSLVAPSSVTAGCYACHQPLEANRAYQVRTEPDPADRRAPFFPHLGQQRHLPAPVCSVAVCVFCYHTLADQWARYERLSNKIDPYRREYDTHNFICFVCSVRTYRKRLHLIDVKVSAEMLMFSWVLVQFRMCSASWLW